MTAHRGALEQLEQAPRPCEHGGGGEEDDAVRLAHALLEEGAEVAQILRIEEDLAAHHALEEVMEVARIAAGLDLVVREEARKVVGHPAARQHRRAEHPVACWWLQHARPAAYEGEGRLGDIGGEATVLLLHAVEHAEEDADGAAQARTRPRHRPSEQGQEVRRLRTSGALGGGGGDRGSAGRHKTARA